LPADRIGIIHPKVTDSLKKEAGIFCILKKGSM